MIPKYYCIFLAVILMQGCWLMPEKEFKYEQQDVILLEGKEANAIPTDMALPNQHHLVDIIKKNTNMDSISNCVGLLDNALEPSEKYTAFLATNSFFTNQPATRQNPCDYLFIIQGNYDKAELLSSLAKTNFTDTNLLDGRSFSLSLREGKIFIQFTNMVDSTEIKIFDQYAQNAVVHGF